ncbi:MAG: TetR/AcrR family transcriptional regulator [Actinomycetota bacterium]
MTSTGSATSDTRANLLDAAFRLAHRHGVAAVTLEAVASEAGVSKGGLLYHFPSKDSLVFGMVELLQEEFEVAAQHAASRDPRPRGRAARAYLSACVDADPGRSKRWLALIGALVREPALLQPWRDLIAPASAADRAEGSDVVAASIVRLAADGLWLADVLGTQPFAPRMRRKVIERLRALTSEETR